MQQSCIPSNADFILIKRLSEFFLMKLLIVAFVVFIFVGFWFYYNKINQYAYLGGSFFTVSQNGHSKSYISISIVGKSDFVKS